MRDRFGMRIMGLDVGSHTIGVALSDELGLTAQGLETIRRKSTDHDLQELARIVTKYEVSKIVVGLPKNMDGTLGPQPENVRMEKTLERL
jgi:putative Holliday junction resolvase